MYKNYKVGVSVVNYNSAEKVVETVNKIMEYKIIDYIVISDNNSSDNSCLILHTLDVNAKVKIFMNPQNGGWSYGHNIACKYLIEECKVDGILIITPANIFSEDVLKSLAEYLFEKNNNNYAVLSMIMKDCNDVKQKNRCAWKRPNYGDLISSCFFILRKIVRPLSRNDYKITYGKSEKVITVDVVQGSVFIIKAEALKKINFFDEDIFLYNEENVLSANLSAFGYNEGILSWLEYYHEVSFSALKSNSRSRLFSYLFDSQYIYAEKYLRLSNKKLKLLKVAQKYGLFEKKVIEYIRNKIFLLIKKR